VYIVDCDTIAKEIISDSAHRSSVNSIVGADTGTENGIDFHAVAKEIFTKPEKRKLLEAYIHPRVWVEVEKRVNTFCTQKLCVVESALIYETNCESKFLKTIVVSCRLEVQMCRLRKDRKLSDTTIRSYLGMQMSLREKEARADRIISTDCSIEELKERVTELYTYLTTYTGA
jgi:dephospho-CoA kinase